jgi:hypothetical protein
MYATFDITADNYNEFQTIVTFRGDYDPVIVQKDDIIIVIESDDGDWLRVDVPIDYFYSSRRNPCQYNGYVGNYRY